MPLARLSRVAVALLLVAAPACKGGRSDATTGPGCGRTTESKSRSPATASDSALNRERLERKLDALEREIRGGELRAPDRP